MSSRLSESGGASGGKRISRRQALGIGAGVAGAVVVGAAAGGYLAFLTPSGDLKNYAEYLVDDQRELHSGEVRVTFLGTTTLLVDDGTTQLLFDAFITDVSLTRALFGTLATDRAKVDTVLSRVGADRVENIFISHSHYDHVLDAAYVARRTGATLHGSPSTLNVGRGGGVPESRLRGYDPGAPIRIGDFTVTVLRSKHSPGTVGGDGTPITHPLTQPAKARDYLEGGSYDFLVEHGADSLLVKASAGYLHGALDDVHADAMFCGTAGAFGKDAEFRRAFYEETIAKVQPKLFVPMHWNDFFMPVTDHLTTNFKAIDDVAAGWDFLIRKLNGSHAEFAPMEGYSSIVLFGPTGRAA
ncbi:MBL fold metallo-hydrolase [Gryllotalpicola ginsengisoli]|uniref:MBL fold metallo-hydrolase n=1 Tax=Gryllotalpicola ginsengisoli TaxID=444608 RepID=UPI00138AFC62|nr:MBL fold metallo-hydrolase [Gryllotalpicola ginsengisoli]